MSRSSPRPRYRHSLALGLLLGLCGGPAGAEPVLVAVAANFARTLDALATDFHARSGHAVQRSIGATGVLYAQIRQGARFDILLAADQARPMRLVADGQAACRHRFTYAEGRLALWSRDPQRINGPTALHGSVRRLAIANPQLAPYGAAAQQTLQSLELLDQLASRLVRAESIGQAFTLVTTGNADLGLVAYSQVLVQPRGSHYLVPQTLHEPILQDAVLLRRAEESPAALAFVAYLRSASAHAVIKDHGYGVPVGKEMPDSCNQ